VEVGESAGWESSEWRVASGEWFFLEGSAPALPIKIFRSCRITTLPAKNFQTPNEFGAQKVRHQPLAKASGMEYDLTMQRRQPCCGLQSVVDDEENLAPTLVGEFSWRVGLLPSQNSSEWRLAIGEW